MVKTWETLPGRGGGLTVSHAPVRVVLLSIKNVQTPSNPYCRLFAESLPDPFLPTPFSWRLALFSRYDIFHIHWPELLIRSRKPLIRFGQRILLLVLLLRCFVLGVPIIRTVHNESPHEARGRMEGWILHRVDRSTQHWIVMNSQTRTPPEAPRHLILHGHYRSWYQMPTAPEVAENSILSFGEIRRYKNVPALCETFIQLLDAEPDALLTVMGRPGDSGLAAEVEDYTRRSDRIQLHLRFVSDEELIGAISAAHLVALPYLRFHNSGAALLALSVGRPILVPDCVVARELVAEFGTDYVQTFDGELSGTVLQSALGATRTSDLPPPPMPQRDWNLLGHQVAGVYNDALTR